MKKVNRRHVFLEGLRSGWTLQEALEVAGANFRDFNRWVAEGSRSCRRMKEAVYTAFNMRIVLVEEALWKEARRGRVPARRFLLLGTRNLLVHNGR